MRKISVWLTVLVLIVVGCATAINYGYQKSHDDGIKGNVNIISSQAIGIHSVRFIGWHPDDVSASAISDDGLSIIFGLFLDNGDEYNDDTQHIEIAFQNYAKTEQIIKLTPKITTKDTFPIDDPCKNIYFRFGQDGYNKNDTIGQVDSSSYGIKLHPLSIVLNEIVEICDSITRTFSLENSPVMHDSIIVYIDDDLIDPEDYIIDEKEGNITFYRAPPAPDKLIDVDGTSTNGWGTQIDIDVKEGDELEFFEIEDYIVTNSLTHPTKIWIDLGATTNAYDEEGEPVILGEPNPGDSGFNVGDPITGDPMHWKFYDENNNEKYDDGEDIIIEGDQVDAYYYEYQIITADYQWSGEKIRMYIDVGNIIAPGFYEFIVTIEPTNWEGLQTENM